MDQGERLGGRYRLVERIGAGGMGEVWRATDEVLGRTVAVKTMLPAIMDDPGFARRFLGEAKAMAALRHPGVVAIHDFHSGDDGAFLVMEYVPSESLAQVLRRVGKLDWRTTLDLVAQVADALQAAHTAGLVHRDVKPANLLVRPDGSLVLTDFGIARLGDQTSLTTPGALLGTPSYLSPEQVMGHPATWLSDIYALGVVGYECLSGERPFTGENPYAIALQRVHDQPRTMVTDAPRAVLEVIEVALATDAAHRWQSASDFARAARGAAAAGASPGGGADDRRPVRPVPDPRTTASATPVAASSTASAVPVRRRIWPVLVGVLAVVILAGGGWILGNGSPGDAGPQGAQASPAVAANLAACGDLLCPTTPLCWGGLVSISGRAQPPGRVDCTIEHRWETFLAARLPADAVEVRQDRLLERPDIAAVCSAARLAERSVDESQTDGWTVDAWPVELADNSWIFHCMVNAGAESEGSVIRLSS